MCVLGRGMEYASALGKRLGKEISKRASGLPALFAAFLELNISVRKMHS